MAVVKAKPTSPGRRFVVKVVDKSLHKGAPHKPLLDRQSKTGGRNNASPAFFGRSCAWIFRGGAITVRHVNFSCRLPGGHPRFRDFGQSPALKHRVRNTVSALRIETKKPLRSSFSPMSPNPLSRILLALRRRRASAWGTPVQLLQAAKAPRRISSRHWMPPAWRLSDRRPSWAARCWRLSASSEWAKQP